MPKKKLVISFGMVSIPVTLEKAVRPHDIRFNMLCKDGSSRVEYKKTCNNKEVKKEEIVKGYKYGDDEYVVLTDEELERIKTKKDKMINIISFIPPESVDAIYFNTSYLLLPQDTGKKAFDILYQAMRETKLWAVAKSVLNNREMLMILRCTLQGIILQTLHYHDEIVHEEKYDFKKSNKEELNLAKLLIKNLQKDFKIQDYEDDYKKRLEEAIEKKIAGKKITKTKEKETDKSETILQALRVSISKIKGGDRASS